MDSFEKHEWNNGFTANDACILAGNVEIERNTKEYTEILDKIYNAALDGKYGLNICTLSKAVEIKLKELGYKVERVTYRNETEVTISWKGGDNV